MSDISERPDLAHPIGTAFGVLRKAWSVAHNVRHKAFGPRKEREFLIQNPDMTVTEPWLTSKPSQ